MLNNELSCVPVRRGLRSTHCAIPTRFMLPNCVPSCVSVCASRCVPELRTRCVLHTTTGWYKLDLTACTMVQARPSQPVPWYKQWYKQKPTTGAKNRRMVQLWKVSRFSRKTRFSEKIETEPKPVPSPPNRPLSLPPGRMQGRTMRAQLRTQTRRRISMTTTRKTTQSERKSVRNPATLTG